MVMVIPITSGNLGCAKRLKKKLHLVVVPGNILHRALLQGQRHPSAVVDPEGACQAQNVASALGIHHVSELHSGNAPALARLCH